MTKNKSKNSQASSKNASKVQLLLPKEYLSWSQIELWNKNKPEYIQRYFHGKESFTNDAMEYGKKFALAMETGDAGEDILLHAISSGVPKFTKAEYKLEAKLGTEWGDIPLLGFIDSSQDNPCDGFREYKTGQHPWTQRKVDTHGQITLYALMVYLNEKKLPKEIFLDWIETYKDDSGKISVTGKVVTFETSRQIGDLLEMTTIIKRTASEIHGAYNNFLQSLV